MIGDNPLLKTIGEVVSLTDGIAEYTSQKTLDVLLPRKVARALKVSESVTFTTTAEATNCYFVTYNAEIFQRLSALLGETGYLTSFGVKYEGYLKQSGFEKLVTKTLLPLNGLIRFVKAVPAITPYVLFNIAYTADSDEKRLGMVSFFVNGITGVSGVDVGDALSWESDRIEVPEERDRPIISFEQLLELSQQIARRYIEREVQPWRNSLNRKLKRDEERIKSYYQAIIQEIRTKITKKNLEGEEQDKELARITATQMELKRKQADLQERYGLKVTARLHSALVIWLQTVQIECQLVRKKNKRSVIAVWNPYRKEIEPLRCEKSNEPVTSFYLTDNEVQIVSPDLFT